MRIKRVKQLLTGSLILMVGVWASACATTKPPGNTTQVGTKPAIQSVKEKSLGGGIRRPTSRHSEPLSADWFLGFENGAAYD